ncbi:hypothetical protein pdam_00004305, partial [Pocillopora damicornis]
QRKQLTHLFTLSLTRSLAHSLVHPFRNQKTTMVFINLNPALISNLNITRITSIHVPDGIDCRLACLKTNSCFSYNLAVLPSVNAKLLCELTLAPTILIGTVQLVRLSVWMTIISAHTEKRSSTKRSELQRIRERREVNYRRIYSVHLKNLRFAEDVLFYPKNEIKQKSCRVLIPDGIQIGKLVWFEIMKSSI